MVGFVGIFRRLSDGLYIYLPLYVDEMLVSCKNKKERNCLKTQMNLEFEMKDLGEMNKIRGMKNARNRMKGVIHLTKKKKKYLTKVLQMLGMDSTTELVNTLLVLHFKLSALLSPRIDNERKYMAHVSYESLVISLMYSIICT